MKICFHFITTNITNLEVVVTAVQRLFVIPQDTYVVENGAGNHHVLGMRHVVAHIPEYRKSALQDPEDVFTHDSAQSGKPDKRRLWATR